MSSGFNNKPIILGGRSAVEALIVPPKFCLHHGSRSRLGPALFANGSVFVTARFFGRLSTNRSFIDSKTWDKQSWGWFVLFFNGPYFS
jgi:hypothetical protein